MSLYVQKQLTKKEAIQYNKDQAKFITDSLLNNVSFGCVSSRACENCYALISDSTCFCIPYFTCPKCGYKNGAEIEENMKNIPRSTTHLSHQDQKLNNFLSDLKVIIAKYENNS